MYFEAEWVLFKISFLKCSTLFEKEAFAIQGWDMWK